MSVEYKPLVEINQEALRLLYKELGIVDAVRFLRQITRGFGDFTKEREDLYGEKGLEEILNEIERHRKSV